VYNVAANDVLAIEHLQIIVSINSMKVFRIELRLFSLPVGWIFKGQNIRLRFFISLRLRCIVCSYTAYFISFVNVCLPVHLTFKSMDGVCCKLYRVRS